MKSKITYATLYPSHELPQLRSKTAFEAYIHREYGPSYSDIRFHYQRPADVIGEDFDKGLGDDVVMVDVTGRARGVDNNFTG